METMILSTTRDRKWAVFFAAGSRPLILGPGSLETAHTPDEQIAFAEVVTAARIYAALWGWWGGSGKHKSQPLAPSAQPPIKKGGA